MRKAEKVSWLCNICGDHVPFVFMLRDELWLSIARKNELLCIPCTEFRLGRKLVMNDFKPCGLTRLMEYARTLDS